MKDAPETILRIGTPRRATRVAIVAPFDHRPLGGQAVFARRLADEAERYVHVVRLSVPRRTTGHRLRRWAAGVRLACRLAWLIVRRRVEVVHLFSPCHRMALFEKLLLAALARALGAQTVFNLRNALDQWAPRWRRWERWAAARLIRNNTIVLCQYRGLADYLVAEGLARGEQVRVIANGLPAEERSVRRSAGLSKQVVRIVFVGSVGVRKGVDLLVEAARLLDTRARRAFVVEIVGPAERGREMEWIQRAAWPLVAKGRLKFRGPVSGDARRELLGAADLFVLPSRAEGLPNSLLEAMGASLPVVVSDRGGMPEVVTSGVEGLVVPADQVVALAEALRALLDDPQRRARMGRAARRRIETCYSMARVVGDFCALYETLAATRRGEAGILPLGDGGPAKGLRRAS